jgi:hypothetical protein
MKSRNFVLLGLFITLTLQITSQMRDDAIYGRHLRVSAFHVSILQYHMKIVA